MEEAEPMRGYSEPPINPPECYEPEPPDFCSDCELDTCPAEHGGECPVERADWESCMAEDRIMRLERKQELDPEYEAEMEAERVADLDAEFRAELDVEPDWGDVEEDNYDSYSESEIAEMREDDE